MEDQKNPTDQAVEDTAAVHGGGPDHVLDLVIAGDATQSPAADPVTAAAATPDPAAEALAKMTGPGADLDHTTGMVVDQTDS